HVDELGTGMGTGVPGDGRGGAGGDAAHAGGRGGAVAVADDVGGGDGLDGRVVGRETHAVGLSVELGETDVRKGWRGQDERGEDGGDLHFDGIGWCVLEWDGDEMRRRRKERW